MGATGLKNHGITEETVQNLMFSAGAYYKNLKVPTSTTEKWTGTPLGATSGGGGFTVKPNYEQLQLDGATVAVKGTYVKNGEVASMKMNMTEFTEGVVVGALHLVEDTKANITGYKKFVSKANLEEDDYLENIAFVGKLIDGRQVIVVMENAICVGAFEVDPKNGSQATYELEYQCTADITQDDLEHLPYHIYFPQEVEV